MHRESNRRHKQNLSMFCFVWIWIAIKVSLFWRVKRKKITTLITLTETANHKQTQKKQKYLNFSFFCFVCLRFSAIFSMFWRQSFLFTMFKCSVHTKIKTFSCSTNKTKIMVHPCRQLLALACCTWNSLQQTTSNTSCGLMHHKYFVVFVGKQNKQKQTNKNKIWS